MIGDLSYKRASIGIDAQQASTRSTSITTWNLNPEKALHTEIKWTTGKAHQLILQRNEGFLAPAIPMLRQGWSGRRSAHPCVVLGRPISSFGHEYWRTSSARVRLFRRLLIISPLPQPAADRGNSTPVGRPLIFDRLSGPSPEPLSIHQAVRVTGTRNTLDTALIYSVDQLKKRYTMLTQIPNRNWLQGYRATCSSASICSFRPSPSLSTTWHRHNLSHHRLSPPTFSPSF
jgi:hypothetical protein